MVFRCDVLIIGAGAAGLSAARELKKRGRSVKVVEARSRVGGRMWTYRDAKKNLSVEMGPEFIHGDSGPVWDLLNEHSLPAYDVADGHSIFKGRRLVKEKKYWDELHAVLGQLNAKQNPDRSFSEFLDSRPSALSRKVRAMLGNYVQGFHAADPEKISERSLAIAEGGSEEGAVGKIFRPVGGYLTIISLLEKELSKVLDLDRAAQKIRWKKNFVETEKCGI